MAYKVTSGIGIVLLLEQNEYIKKGDFGPPSETRRVGLKIARLLIFSLSLQFSFSQSRFSLPPLHTMVSTAVKRRLSDASDQTDNKMLKTEPVEEQEPTREERQQKIFSRMHLRRIIKENHGSDIHQLAFFFNNKNFSAPVGLDVNKTFDKRGSVQRQQTDTSNVFASVGGCQVRRIPTRFSVIAEP